MLQWSNALSQFSFLGDNGLPFKYLNVFSSGLINVNIGHGDQRVTDAVVKQMQKVSYVNPSTITKVRGELGKKLSEICPGNLNKSFFTICGATGIENAIKLARLYTGRHKILTRYRSYHGSTMGAMSEAAFWTVSRARTLPSSQQPAAAKTTSYLASGNQQSRTLWM